MIVYKGKEYDDRHGGPFDRGAADSWYQRSRRPHFFSDATHRSEEIEERFMTKAQIDEYLAGYSWNESMYQHKDYGR